ncbi:MAG: hypothetical protein ACOH2V_00800 [Candidatus Saccharimonadaceae bacterium]
MEKLGQEPAFATSAFGNGQGVWESGMSKRFYAACAVLPAIIPCVNIHAEDTPEYLAKKAYEIVDELLKQENL